VGASSEVLNYKPEIESGSLIQYLIDHQHLIGILILLGIILVSLFIRFQKKKSSTKPKRQLTNENIIYRKLMPL